MTSSRRGTWFRAIGGVVLWALLICLPERASYATGTVPVRDMKAAYLYNFAVFTEWPDKKEAVQLCLMPGMDEQLNLDLLENKTVGGKKLIVSRLSRGRPVQSCDMLYVAERSQADLAAMMQVIQASPVLTIGMGKDSPAMIRMSVDANRLVFSVRLAAVQHANLVLSSKLLRLATSVDEGSHDQ